MQSKSKWPTILIVTITLGLVFGPVFVPREVSRWYLAAAQNAFRKKDSVLAEHYLKRAEAWDPTVIRDADYWIAQLPQANIQNVDQFLDLIEHAVMTDSRWRLQAFEASKMLSEEYDFQHAVRALKIASLGQRPTAPLMLNQLAYMRAQAGIELEDALKDIELAIKIDGPLPSYLDTKAWVLYGLKRNLEALGFVNKAIEGQEELYKKKGIAMPKPLELETSKTAEVADDNDLDFLEQPPAPVRLPSIQQRQAEIKKARRRMGDPGFDLAILRFHRLRILEALKDPTEAVKDRRWLEERGVPIVDELF